MAVSSEILDRLPPQNLEAERGVLGSILLDPQFIDEVAVVLRPEDFYAEAHRKLFFHIVTMRTEGKKVDVTLLVERLKLSGEYEAVGGASCVADVLHSVAVPSHAVYYAHIVRDKAILRELIHASTEILRSAYDPTSEPRALISDAEKRILAVHETRASDQVFVLDEVLLDAFKKIDARLAQGGASGLPTGFTDLDKLVGGLQDGELTILAARPSMGKTALALNIVDYVTAESDKSALFVSLEMSRLEVASRMLCSRADVNGEKLRSGFLSADDRKMLVSASSKLSRAPLYIDDTPSRTMTEIAATARRLKHRKDLSLLVVDYLQLIEPDSAKDTRQEQVAKIARRLKGLARELQIPVLCLAQLNRQTESARENRPRLSHLRESGAIEQDADVVMFIHREEYYQTREEAAQTDTIGKAEVIVSKQRNGPTGEVKLCWFQKFAKFASMVSHPRGHAEFESYRNVDEF